LLLEKRTVKLFRHVHPLAARWRWPPRSRHYYLSTRSKRCFLAWTSGLVCCCVWARAPNPGFEEGRVALPPARGQPAPGS
jgi:hypothetical protein